MQKGSMWRKQKIRDGRRHDFGQTDSIAYSALYMYAIIALTFFFQRLTCDVNPMRFIPPRIILPIM